MIEPAKLYSYEKFGVALEGGLTFDFFNERNFSPFLSGNYFIGTANFDFAKGYDGGIDFEKGHISDQGFLFTCGLGIKL